ncbi:Hsp70 family protein [Nocardia sp. CDC186]|uniref:Hsp70 family protein n=1 Tax=Nocardia implantans TaxID=3108168 RepID=A0ABU6AW35_9NOCA|nr:MULTISPECIES: Hsp70 family protein [unclassified Nocardia]MBF6192989.1 Hsp70 family protein [Nocardia beijingensis]MEA3532432.1 Hsp70 family protein [Nocardia sp. CDC192]MEB3511639.1 Hsp70 family protein [Nocardia sp. CDC186]
MRTSLGISAGAEVVCSALVSTAPNGTQSFDYRVVSADAAHSDLGDLVASSIELMTTQLPTTQPPREIIRPAGGRFAGAPRHFEPMTGHPPTSVAVAYRTKEQAQIIRSATGKQRDLRLVQEGTAALTYLRHTGLLDRYDTVAIVDLGASGLSVTVADRAEGSLLRSDRTAAVSGTAIDDLIYHHLVDLHFARRGTRPNRGTLTNRGRAAKEHLSIAPAVTIDHVAGRPLKLTRADFEELIADLLRDLARFVTMSFARAPEQPQAVAVIGGGANIPAVLDTLTAAVDVPVFTVPDPEAVTAKGAALVADSMQPSVFPVSGLGGDAPAGTVTKVFGTLAGAIVVVGLIVGYGVKTFAPTSDDEVSPAGTTSSASQLPNPASVPQTTTAVTTPDGTGIAPTTTERGPQSTTGGPWSTPAIPPTQPTLRPDPNLPPIPFPELLGPLFGNPNAAPNSLPAAPSATAPGTSPAPTQAPARTSLPLPLRDNSGSASHPGLFAPN